jgi:hypothetical protein
VSSLIALFSFAFHLATSHIPWSVYVNAKLRLKPCNIHSHGSHLHTSAALLIPLYHPSITQPSNPLSLNTDPPPPPIIASPSSPLPHPLHQRSLRRLRPRPPRPQHPPRNPPKGPFFLVCHAQRFTSSAPATLLLPLNLYDPHSKRAVIARTLIVRTCSLLADAAPALPARALRVRDILIPATVGIDELDQAHL